MKTPFDEWMERFGLVDAPRAAGLIFDWCLTSASYDLEPQVIEAKYGDGYAQRRAAGINTQNREWSCEMRNASPGVTADVLAFLEARNGVDVFSWTPPRTTTAQDVICPSWTCDYGDLVAGGVRLMNISMKFQQVHQ